jgi:hypothetical protein
MCEKSSSEALRAVWSEHAGVRVNPSEDDG